MMTEGSNLDSLLNINWDPALKSCTEGDPNRDYELFFELYEGAYDSAFPSMVKNKGARAKVKTIEDDYWAPQIQQKENFPLH